MLDLLRSGAVLHDQEQDRDGQNDIPDVELNMAMLDPAQLTHPPEQGAEKDAIKTDFSDVLHLIGISGPTREDGTDA